MNSSVMGIINLQYQENAVQELSKNRSVASVPFAGRYRLIDFAVSSMVNSGINHVGVLLPNKPRSILDHLRSGKDWDLALRHNGLFYLPAVEDPSGAHEGDLRSFYHNLDFFEHSKQKYVLITTGNFIYNIDFDKMLRFHQNTNADITAVYTIAAEEMDGDSIVLETAENGLVEDIAMKPVTYEDSKVSLGIMLTEKSTFVDMVRVAFEHGGSDFLLDGIVRRMGEYTIYGYRHEGYAAQINSVPSYYKASMDALRPEIWEELFLSKNAIYTKIKDGVHVQYKDTAKVKNSLIANGCLVRGEVENSILFRGVNVGEGVKIKNSIIMQKCDIEDNSIVENVICDKNVTITPDKWLKGAPNYPLIISKNVVI